MPGSRVGGMRAEGRPERAGLALPVVLLVALLAGSLAAVVSCQRPPPGYKVVAAKEGYTHVITAGETLESIAQKYYGDQRLGRALGEYNDLDPLKELAPGATLLVPFNAGGLVEITRTNEGYVAYNRGTMLARTGQYEEALGYLEKAVGADPSNSDAWYNLAVVYQKLGRLSDALPIMERLVWAQSDQKTYQYTYGSLLRNLDRKKDALKAFKTALKADSEYREAQYAMALTLEDLGRKKQAVDAWRRYLELDQDSLWSEEARIHLKNLGSE
ncbi:MAG: tetratricopeptide repeat protein [bacterium]